MIVARHISPFVAALMLVGHTACYDAADLGHPARRLCPTSPAAQPPRLVGADLTLRLLCLNFDTMQMSEGSGFLVSSDGLLVTCRHVASGRTPLGVVLGDGRRMEVSGVLAEDEQHDLALLRVEGGGGFASLPLSTTRPLSGDKVWAITRIGVSAGRVTDEYTDEAMGDLLGFSDPSLGPGASGGALVDQRGEVVGVIRGAVDDDPKQCGAVPVECVRQLLREVGPELNRLALTVRLPEPQGRAGPETSDLFREAIVSKPPGRGCRPG